MKNILFRTLMLLAVLASSVTTWAQGSGSKDDPCVMEAGTDYNFKMAEWYGKFIIPEDVTADNFVIEISCSVLSLDAYSDADYTQQLTMDHEGNYAPYTFKLPIAKGTAKGTVIYFKKDFDIQADNGKITITSYGNPSAIKLVSVTPIPSAEEGGKPLSAASAYVSLSFSKSISSNGCTVAWGEEIQAVVANAIGKDVSLDLRAALLDFYGLGMKEGDEITVTLKSVAAKDGSSSLGDVVVKYLAAALPVSLESSVNTPGNGLDTFLSWMPETFENGVVTLTFSGNLSTEAKPVAVLSMGNVESENDYYREELPVVISGNKLSVDLRGKLRNKETMGIQNLYEEISLQITGVKDAQGNFTYSDGAGTLGSYGFTYKYKAVEYTLTTEFAPGKGSIDNKKSIELWIREEGDGKLSFKAARFGYVYEGKEGYVDVEAKDIASEVDPDDKYATILTIPVPEFSRDANTEVVLSLVGVVTPDGNDHSADLTAKYTTEGVTTAISGINADNNIDGKAYNINGIPVKNTNNSGLYIINGKTVIVK
ncbi:MAG: hypothetical protein ACI3YT_04345 [Prevotella sp.]